MPMTREEQLIHIAQMRTVFRPGTPINKFALFAGRQKQVTDIMRAINQNGQHIVIFGERGVGKTSLSKVLVELLTRAGTDVISPDTINCDGTDDFPRIWAKVFRELFALIRARNRETDREIFMPENEISWRTPDDIRFALSRLPDPAIIVLDEVDRITNAETTTLLADTIKNLSDHATPSTIILIGVADSIDDLIREHRSTERAIVQIPMPRMSAEELYEILKKGEEVGITFSADAARHIVKLSAGLPHYTHTLAAFACEHAIADNRLNVTMPDVTEATHEMVDSPGSLLSIYERATLSARQNWFQEVLLACALADKSDLGYFTAVNVRAPLERITGRQFKIPAFAGHLDAFSSEKRGNVLQKTGIPRRFRFRFENPLLQPFVIIHGLAKGLIDPEVITFKDKPDTDSLFPEM